MRRFLITAGIIIASVTVAGAQYLEDPEYNTAIGIRAYPGAVTVKSFFQPQSAIEGLVYFWKGGTRITALYEWHHGFANAEGLKWYVGGGAHVEFKKTSFHEEGQTNNTAIGIDGVIGLDYKFPNNPLNLALDWQPSGTFINDNYTNLDWLCISVRFAF